MWWLRHCVCLCVILGSIACGLSSLESGSLHIIGRDTVPLTQTSATVILKRKGYALCEGGYIAPGRILTAGHCAKKPIFADEVMFFFIKDVAQMQITGDYLTVPVTKRATFAGSDVGMVFFEERLLQKAIKDKGLTPPTPAPLYLRELEKSTPVFLEGFAGTMVAYKQKKHHMRQVELLYYPLLCGSNSRKVVL